MRITWRYIERLRALRAEAYRERELADRIAWQDGDPNKSYCRRCRFDQAYRETAGAAMYEGAE